MVYVESLMACSLRGVGWACACRESVTLRGLMAVAGIVGMLILQTQGGSPLLVASLQGHVVVVRALVVAGADVGQVTVSESVRRIERHSLNA